MQSVHLVGEDEDDLYSGFNDYNAAFDTEVRRDSAVRWSIISYWNCMKIERCTQLYWLNWVEIG